MREKIVLIGAGSMVFTQGLVCDILSANWTCDLVLVDIDTDALAIAEGIARKMIEQRRAPITLSATTERTIALKGATAVITTIAVGGRRAWELDVFVPREFGIYQPVGDTAMPGGTSRALRMIPAMIAIAEDVLSLAPDALFINYGNPMTAICAGVRKATGANIIGLCHGVSGVAAYLARALSVSPEALRYSAVGINHLTWFTEVSVRGQNLLPRLQEIADVRIVTEQAGNQGEHFSEVGSGSLTNEAIDNRLSWHLLKLFGAFPAALDRHVSEFFPWMFGKDRYYGKTLGVDAYSFEATIRHGDECYEKMQEDAFSASLLTDNYFREKGEDAIRIINSLRCDDTFVYFANLPNTGQVPNLPQGSIVETAAVSHSGQVCALQQKPLTPGLVGTLATRLAWVDTVVEAACTGSCKKFIEALVLDGAVTSLAGAEALADALLLAQAEHLPHFSTGVSD